MYTIENSGILHNWRFVLGDIVAVELSLFLSYLLREYLGGIVNNSYYFFLGLASIFILIALAFFQRTIVL